VQVIGAIRSRCLGIRVAAPSADEIVKVLNHVAKKEGIRLPEELASTKHQRRAALRGPRSRTAVERRRSAHPCPWPPCLPAPLLKARAAVCGVAVLPVSQDASARPARH